MALHKHTLIGYLFIALLGASAGYVIYVNREPAPKERRQRFWEGVRKFDEVCAKPPGPRRDHELAVLLQQYYPEVQEAQCRKNNATSAEA